MHFHPSSRWLVSQKIAARYSLISSTGKEQRRNACARSVASYYIRCGFRNTAAILSDRNVEYYGRNFGNVGNYRHFAQISSRDQKGDSKSENEEMIYFHVSPSGDWWTGPPIFAAKHLQPDYVRSIPIPSGFDPHAFFGDHEQNDDQDRDNNSNTIRLSVMSWEQKQDLLCRIYDDGEFPSEMLIDCNFEGIKDDGTGVNKP